MKTYTRQASVSWRGTPRHGKGAISLPRSLKLPYASGNNERAKITNPPELIAAAHAGSYSISLAHELGVAGFNPNQIETTATVTMEPVAAGWKMTQIHLDVVASVPRALQCDFIDAAMRAKANCAISQLVSANISMCARLNPQGEASLLPYLPLVPRGLLAQKNKGRRNRARN
jgi:osmotically inducible protein OsmC